MGDGKLILYGCGAFLNDCEGTSVYDEFRDDLALMYLSALEHATGRLVDLVLVPMRIRHFRMNHASREDAAWLRDAINRASRGFGVRIELSDTPHLELHMT